jgi:hypothetical protein
MDIHELERQYRARLQSTPIESPPQTVIADPPDDDHEWSDSDDFLDALELLEKVMEDLDGIIEDNPFSLSTTMLQTLKDRRLDICSFVDAFIVIPKEST